jgi:hypothetical protein
MAAPSGKAQPFLRSCVRDAESRGRGAGRAASGPADAAAAFRPTAPARRGEECLDKLREPAQPDAEFARQLPCVLRQSSCSIPMSATRRSRRQKNAAL